jgi:hypothetical protein
MSSGVTVAVVSVSQLLLRGDCHWRSLPSLCCCEWGSIAGVSSPRSCRGRGMRTPADSNGSVEADDGDETLQPSGDGRIEVEMSGGQQWSGALHETELECKATWGIACLAVIGVERRCGLCIARGHRWDRR